MLNEFSFHVNRMNVDSRGAKRGRCDNNCDCQEYERHVEKTSSDCAFCHCPPTKHQLLGMTLKKSQLFLELYGCG